MASSQLAKYASQADIQSQVRGWYFDPKLLGNDILVKAYQEAIAILKNELTPEEYDEITKHDSQRANVINTSNSSIPSNSNHNMDSFLSTLSQLQQTYARSRNDKARRWLNTLSDRVVYYGNIMDVLVQHHPEYVSLAWGAFKILFVAVTNHATTISKISKSLSQISLLLPSTNLTLILYPTEALLDTVARMYSLILRFLLDCIKFYKASRFQHSIDSLFRPWKLRFQDTYDDIALHATQLKDLSSLAAKAELRDVHMDLIESRKVFNNINSEILQMKHAQANMEALIESKVAEQTALLSSLYTEIRMNLSDQTQTINQIHLNQLLTMPFWQRLPSSGESLEYCQSMRRSRLNWSAVVLPQEQDLQNWAQQPTSNLLAVSGNSSVVQKDFMTDMATLIREQNFPVLWALRFADHWELDLTTTDIVRILVLQALQLNPSSLKLCEQFGKAKQHPITLTHLKEAASLDDWVRILEECLRGLHRIFILLDGDLISQATQYDRHEAMQLIELLRNKMKMVVKIVTPASNFDRDHIQTLRALGECINIATDGSLKAARKPNRMRVKSFPVKRRLLSNWMTSYSSKRQKLM